MGCGASSAAKSPTAFVPTTTAPLTTIPVAAASDGNAAGAEYEAEEATLPARTSVRGTSPVSTIVDPASRPAIVNEPAQHVAAASSHDELIDAYRSKSIARGREIAPGVGKAAGGAAKKENHEEFLAAYASKAAQKGWSRPTASSKASPTRPPEINCHSDKATQEVLLQEGVAVPGWVADRVHAAQQRPGGLSQSPHSHISDEIETAAWASRVVYAGSSSSPQQSPAGQRLGCGPRAKAVLMAAMEAKRQRSQEKAVSPKGSPARVEKLSQQEKYCIMAGTTKPAVLPLRLKIGARILLTRWHHRTLSFHGLTLEKNQLINSFI